MITAVQSPRFGSTDPESIPEPALLRSGKLLDSSQLRLDEPVDLAEGRRVPVRAYIVYQDQKKANKYSDLPPEAIKHSDWALVYNVGWEKPGRHEP